MGSLLSRARKLQSHFPRVRVEEDRIFIIDGPIWTSAGMTAAMDLALAMVEKDLGDEVARSVAHRLVMSQRRHTPRRVRVFMDWLTAQLGDRLPERRIVTEVLALLGVGFDAL